MDALIKKTRNDKRIIVSYILAFLLLLLTYLILLSKNRQLVLLSDSVDHTTDLIVQLEAIGSKVKDAETGVRGYILTKNNDLLMPYYGSKEHVDSLYFILLRSTKDNQLQQTRLDRLKKSIDRRFKILISALYSFDNNNQQMPDSILLLQGESNRLMTNIRSTIAQMQQEEYKRLNLRRDKLNNAFTILNTISIISLSISLILSSFVIIISLKALKQRKESLLRIRHYQEQLTNHIEELNSANLQLLKIRSQEKFAATGRIARTIAHEVRNPLTNINLAAEQLRTELINPDENTAFLFEMIDRNSSRINQLISDLLNSTKFSELTFEKISINDLLEEALQDAADRIALSNVKVVKQYSADICGISVDKAKIKIAFLNIIINALEAMEDKEKGQLTLETKAENGKCKIIISDNGIGMDEDSISRLFEPYFTNKSKGNGLGLTNTQNIILNHKGDISVKSKIGAGTTFTITLDIAA